MSIKSILKKTLLHKAYRKLKESRDFSNWQKGDKTGAPPHTVKELAVKEYGRKYNLTTLLETGTYLGDMVDAVKNDFEHIYFIEIDRALQEQAAKMFSRHKQVKILLGDSGVVLSRLKGEITGGVLFWPDGHYSAGATGRGTLDSPIMQELETIFSWPLTGAAILIDDARMFVGQGGYPTLADLREFVHIAKPGWQLEVKHDIIRITPN